MDRRTVLKGGLVLAASAHTAVATAEVKVPAEISIDDFLARASAAERAWYHVNALAKVMNEIHPGAYLARVDHATRMAVVYDMNS